MCRSSTEGVREIATDSPMPIRARKRVVVRESQHKDVCMHVHSLRSKTNHAPLILRRPITAIEETFDMLNNND